METTVEVTEQSQIAEVRRVVAELARVNGMSESDMGRAALVATESASNLVKYAKRGQAMVSWFEEGGASGVQIITADQGPGFASFEESARDGFSSGGSLGLGLGILKRTADVFDHYSVDQAGAALFLRVAKNGVRSVPQPRKLVLGSRSLPKPGEVQCGDSWAFRNTGRLQSVCIVDGLGHGPLAALAAAEAIRCFLDCPAGDGPAELIRKASKALKATRGAVMAIATIDTELERLSFSGIGNIAAIVFGEEKVQRLSSTEGIVGFNVQSLRQHSYPWARASTLVMNTDGLSSRWNLNNAPGLLAKHPALIAAVLHRDFARDTDDSTVVVARSLA